MDFYDLIVCLAVAMLAYRGLRRGLVGELVGLAIFACGMVLALRLDAAVGRRLVDAIPRLSATEGRVLAFALILVVVGVVLGALGRRLSRLVSRIPVVGGLNRLGGLVVGVALALACVWLVTAVVQVLPAGLVPFSATVRHSETAHLLHRLDPGVDAELRAHLGQIGVVRVSGPAARG
jgi:membrane protein required for colicin V production